jgi:hypothetical protein
MQRLSIRFEKTILPPYSLNFSKGHAFLLVYSVTSKQSLEELLPIIKMLMEVKGNEMSDVPIVLVGNKTDEKEVSFLGVLTTLADTLFSNQITNMCCRNEKSQRMPANALAKNGDALLLKRRPKTTKTLSSKCYSLKLTIYSRFSDSSKNCSLWRKNANLH